MSVFNLLKTAMGDKWGVYRGSYEWFKYDDIINGQNERWNRWARINHSLKFVLREVTHTKQAKEKLFADRYGLTPEQISKIYFVYIAYNPRYGIYACHVGPYHGAKPSDAMNKFGYFTRRYQTANKDEITRTFSEYIGESFQEYKDILDMSDFKMVLKKETDRLTGRGYDKEQETINSLDPNTEDGKRLYARRPVMGTGSYMFPNAKGISKMLQKASQDGNWQAVLDQVVNNMAQANKITPEQAREMLNSDEQFVVGVYNELKKVVVEMVKQGNPAAQLMSNIPAITAIPHKRAGAQRTEALDTKPIQRAMILLKKEVLETMVKLGTDDPQAIMNELNKPRMAKVKAKLMAQGLFTPEIVQYWLDYINQERAVTDASGNMVNEKTVEQVLAETTHDLETLLDNAKKKEEGFDSLEKTFQMLSLYFTEAPKETIDPITRAKMTMPLVVPPVIDFEEEEKESMKTITSEQLAAWRKERDEQKAMEEASKKEIEQDIGEEDEVVPGQPPATPPTTPPGTPPSEAFPVTEVPQEKDITSPETAPETTPEQPVEDTTQKKKPKTPYKPNLKNLITNSLREMIRIAQELDDEGKTDAAEEIHKIIRKYI